jgi:L-lysine exporter family protein LysE/ArgO
MQPFISGFLLALGLIIPLGVQNIFIFNQGIIQRQWVHALPSMLTAFICDATLILLAIVGISEVLFSFPAAITAMYIVGFVFLMFMGWKTWTSAASTSDNIKPLSTKQQILFAMSVSLLNPHALVDTVMVIGTNSANFIGADKLLFTVACVSVSFIWFLTLSVSGYCLKKVDSFDKISPWINKVSAVIIWGVGLYIGAQLWA